MIGKRSQRAILKAGGKFPILTAGIEVAEMVLADRKPAAVISIGEVASARPAGLEGFAGPMLRLDLSDVLRGRDLDGLRHASWCRRYSRRRLPPRKRMFSYTRPPEASHIRQAIDFIKATGPFDTDRFLLVHCSVGMSRSPAIALLAWYLQTGNVELAFKGLVGEHPFASPNLRMIMLIEEVLGLDFRTPGKTLLEMGKFWESMAGFANTK